VPPVGPESKLLGSINIGNTAGGTNWPGAGFDVETGIFYSQAGMTNVTAGHYSEEEFAKVTPENKGNRTPRWEAEPNYGLRRETPAAPPAGGAPPAAVNFPGGEGRRKLSEGLEGLPIVKPPYGVLSAIDLKNPDKLLFQVPHGDTPDNIKNHPLLKGMNIPKTGQSGSVGVMITKNFVASGDPGITTVNGVRGASLRAYDKMTGAQLGEVRVPAPILGMPMTYMVDGRQYIVVGVSGGNYTGEYIAFRLPQSELPRTNTARQQ
jgi:quinoprotein glucose dehydrogenase